MTEPPKKRESLYERQLRARRWMWSTLTDEAVMVYRRSAHGKKRARVLFVEFFLFIREVIREFYGVQGTSRAASLAYTTLLSLVPLFVAFSQILRGYFSRVFPDFQSQVDYFLNILLPYRSAQISYHISRFAENAEAASTVGIIAFLLVSFRLFLAVEATVNNIWRVSSARGYRQKIRSFTMLFFWGPILMGLSFTTSASLEKSPYLRVFFSPAVIAAVPMVVLFVAFTMLFWLVPSTRVHIKSAAVGALITTVAFQLVRWGFGVYAQSLFAGNLNVIYGTLGLVVLFIFSLELIWVVILLGVQISYVYQNLQGLLRASEQQITENRNHDLYFALRALVEISRRFETREDAPSSYRLAEEFGATDHQMLEVLRLLEDAKLVKEIGGDWTGFAPGCDPDRITVEEVISALEGAGREIPEEGEVVPEKELVRELYTTMHQCLSNALQQRTIGQMVRTLYGHRQPSRAGDPVA